jgi:hypothetical protein
MPGAAMSEGVSAGVFARLRKRRRGDVPRIDHCGVPCGATQSSRHGRAKPAANPTLGAWSPISLSNADAAKRVVGTRSAVAMLSPKSSESRVCHGSALEGCGPGYDGSRTGLEMGRSAQRQTRCRQSDASRQRFGRHSRDLARCAENSRRPA